MPETRQSWAKVWPVTQSEPRTEITVRRITAASVAAAAALCLTATTANVAPATASAAPTRTRLAQLIAAELPMVNSVAAASSTLNGAKAIVKSLPSAQSAIYRTGIATVNKAIATRFSTDVIGASTTLTAVQRLKNQWSFTNRDVQNLVSMIAEAEIADGGDFVTVMKRSVRQLTKWVDQTASAGTNVMAARAALARIPADAKAITPFAIDLFTAFARTDYRSNAAVARAEYHLDRATYLAPFTNLMNDLNTIEALLFATSSDSAGSLSALLRKVSPPNSAELQLIKAELALISSVSIAATTLTAALDAGLDELPRHQAASDQAELRALLTLISTKYSTAKVESSTQASTVRHLSAQWSYTAQQSRDVVSAVMAAGSGAGGDIFGHLGGTAGLARLESLIDHAERDGVNVAPARAAFAHLDADAVAYDNAAEPTFIALARAKYTDHAVLVRLTLRAAKLARGALFDAVNDDLLEISFNIGKDPTLSSDAVRLR
jgi:hypothetical protein